MENCKADVLVRLPALDGLRGIAISLVMSLHFGVVEQFASSTTTLSAMVQRLFYIGWVGVDLFFVLSGFLITSILLRKRDSSNYFKAFYARRALRILPLYYLVTIIVLWILPLLGPTGRELAGDAPTNQIWLWLYATNLGMAVHHLSFGCLDIFWSLAIEEQFYLVWPFIVLKFTPRQLGDCCFCLIFISFILRVTHEYFGLEEMDVYRLTFSRLDGLAIGALLAVREIEVGLLKLLSDKVIYYSGGFAGLACLLLFFCINPFYPTDKLVLSAGILLLNIFFGAVLLATLKIRDQPYFLNNSVLRALGLYSYGIYVLHWPLRLFLEKIGFFNNVYYIFGYNIGSLIFTVFFGSLCSFLLGALSYHLIEIKFLRFRAYARYEI